MSEKRTREYAREKQNSFNTEKRPSFNSIQKEIDISLLPTGGKSVVATVFSGGFLNVKK